MPDELRRIGAQMANVMFNLVQRPGQALTPETVAMMDDLRRQWDAAARVAVDERALLRKYIAHVSDLEGTDFLHPGDQDHYRTDVRFSDAEWAALEVASKAGAPTPAVGGGK